MKLWDFLQEVKIDNKQGIGEVPDNNNVDYLGLRVLMRPSVFLGLASTLNREQASSVDYIKQQLAQGRGIASPWLVIDIPQAWDQNNLDAPARVVSHEGRNRMYAAMETDGDLPLEVHLFFSGGLRRRHIKPAWIAQLNQQLIAQGRTKPTTGPFFSQLNPLQERGGAPGTLKAKISKRYGGSVTCSKTQKLKTRKGASTLDKRQANWFQNKHCGGATKVSEVFQAAPQPAQWEQQGHRYVTEFDFQGEEVHVTAAQDDFYELSQIFDQYKLEIPDDYTGFSITFMVNRSMDISQRLGLQSVKLFGQIIARLRAFLQTHAWDFVSFTGEPGSRNKLYLALAHRLAQETKGRMLRVGNKFAVVKNPKSQDLQALTELVSLPKTPVEWKQQQFNTGRRYLTAFELDNHLVEIRIDQDRSHYSLQNAMLLDPIQINPEAQGYTILFMVDGEIIKTGLFGQKSPLLLAQTFGRILQWLKSHKWDYIIFTGARGSRNKLYGMISRQLAREFNAKMHFDFDTSDFVVYKPLTLAQKLVQEALTWQLPSNNWSIQSQHDRDITYKFVVDGEKYFMEIMNIPEPNNRGIYDIEFFHEEHGMDITGLGVGHAMKVFSAVKQLAQDAQGRLADLPINAWFFSARGASRQKLYLRLAQQLAEEMAWKLTTARDLMPLQGDYRQQGYLIYNPKIENRILNPKLSELQEAETAGSALTIFDIDDTLMKTSAAVYVVTAQGKRTKLTAQEFNSYQLKPGEYFDFQEFEDSDLFHDTSEPIAQIWRTAQNTLANTGRRPGSRVVIITARGPFNNTEKFLKTFEKHGLDMNKVRVFTVGGARNKKPLIRQLLQQHNYTETRIFDDHLGNLKDFLSLSSEFPHVVFKAFGVGPQGQVGNPVIVKGTENV